MTFPNCECVETPSGVVARVAPTRARWGASVDLRDALAGVRPLQVRVNERDGLLLVALHEVSVEVKGDGTDADGRPIRPDELVQPATFRAETSAGSLTVVPEPWGTRGYDDIRIRGNRENLGRGIRPHIASLIDLTRMLEASSRGEDSERLRRLRRLMELERRHTRSRGRSIER